MKQEIISFYAIGAGPDGSVRKIQYGIPQNGWQEFINKYAAIDVAHGYKHIWLHNPFGNLPNREAMSFDQIVETADALNSTTEALNIPALTIAHNTFSPAWLKFLSANGNKDVQVTAYLGKLTGDADFAAADSAEWIERLCQSVSPFLRLRMNIVFDALTNTVEKDTPEYYAALLIKTLSARQNRFSATEPWPRVDSAIADWPIFNLDDSFQVRRRQTVENPKAASWALPEANATSVIRLVLPVAYKGETWQNRETWIYRRIGEILIDGHIPCVNLAFLRNNQMIGHDELMSRCVETASDSGYTKFHL